MNFWTFLDRNAGGCFLFAILALSGAVVIVGEVLAIVAKAHP